MTIKLVRESPLILVVGKEHFSQLSVLDAGAAYTEYLHQQQGEFPRVPLGTIVDLVPGSVDPRREPYASQIFEYVDLREVDEVFGDILALRVVEGREIGSNKHRFRMGDILFAKIMPSLANKKVALVTQDISNGLCSSEFVILRPKPNAEINPYFLFAALRSDDFTRQAEANVTGATGRQRISPTRLLELLIPLPPSELQNLIGDAVEREFRLRTLAKEQAREAAETAEPILGPTTKRTGRPASRTVSRRSV